MGQTSIEWTSYRRSDGTIVPGYTFNPIIGCAKKSPGCKFCYAEHDTPARVARGQGLELWGVDAARKPASESYWKQPHAWNRAAQRDGAPRLVFVASQSDWLEDRPEWEQPRARLLKTVLETPNLIWLLLSKEPWNFHRLVFNASRDLEPIDREKSERIDWWANLAQSLRVKRSDDREWLIPNVRLGVSVENQEWADKRRDAFAVLPGSKFVSYEPAIGLVDWTGWEFVDQIISGGESGKDKGIRPSHPDWHRATRDWCKANGKAYFFKQWGKWKPFSEMNDAENNSLYRSNKIADRPEDQVAVDEVYGRTCKVETSAIGYGGETGTDKAFWTDRYGNDGHSGMQVFGVGKNASGNFLDGHQHLEIPGINFPLEAE